MENQDQEMNNAIPIMDTAAYMMSNTEIELTKENE
jgi:hypothetical protein